MNSRQLLTLSTRAFLVRTPRFRENRARVKLDTVLRKSDEMTVGDGPYGVSTNLVG